MRRHASRRGTSRQTLATSGVSGSVCAVTSTSGYGPLSRRAFLATAGTGLVVLTAGCGSVGDLLDDEPASVDPSTSASSDEQLIDTVLRDQEQLLAAATATLRRHRNLRSTLDPIVDHHRTHVEILGGDPSERARKSSIPRGEPDAIRALAQLERNAAKRRAVDAQRAESGEFARALAGIAASQVQHEYLLDQLVKS